MTRKKQPEQKSFRVTDRRSFDDSGNIKEDRENFSDEKRGTSSAEAPKDTKKDPEVFKTENPDKRIGNLHDNIEKNSEFKVDFPTFVSSLYTTAMMHMGQMPNPVTQNTETDLNLAKHNIDILEMLESKTKGNLDSNEESLLKSALFDLRIKFVALSKKSN